ncbi:TPA: amino acid ABC transporter ATP-binding protein [Klebsiella pneumoniae]|nr:amino acid ABC transporter ATP-binding protein [Klebsiella pneumoniae]
MPESIAVSVKNVSKQFDNVEVLRDINLTVEKGTVVSILGSSGSGKSTLLRCMNWLEQPDRGEIHIGGQRLGIDEQRGRAMSPEVILFDEPTSALDPELVNEVLGVMKALAAEGYTMVVVTHEMDFARQVSNEVVFLEKGLLIEKAPPEKFFTQPDSERVRQFLQSSR